MVVMAATNKERNRFAVNNILLPRGSLGPVVNGKLRQTTGANRNYGSHEPLAQNVISKLT